MITLTVRTSGGDYSSWDAMATAMQANFPLSDHYTINFEGGKVWGQDGYVNEMLGVGTSIPEAPMDWNNKSITLQTDPTELATPAYILGRIWASYVATNYPLLNIKRLKLYGNQDGNYPIMVGGGLFGASNGVKINVEDCFISYKLSGGGDGHSLVATRASAIGLGEAVTVKGCTIALLSTAADGLYYLIYGSAPASYHNNVFCIHNSLLTGDPLKNNPFRIALALTHYNNTFYNYQGNEIIDPPVPNGTWTNSIINQNPNFIEALITAWNDTPAAVIARNQHLTALSTPCLDNADPATATATDIEGNSRA